MTKYYVASNLLHDHREYGRGDTIELSDEQAKSLIEAKTIQTKAIRKEERIEEASPEAPEQASPVVGGAKTVTGEPSMDGREVTPEVEADIDTTEEVGQDRTVRSVAGGSETRPDNVPAQTDNDPSVGL